MQLNRDNFIKALKKHNEKALEYVVDEYGRLLMSIIKKHLYCFPNIQEDCMNEVLFKIWQNIDKYDETRSTFQNWIAGIARYQSIDYLRKYRKELEQMEVLPAERGEEDRRLLRLLEEEISEEAEQMLSCLKEEDRELFILLFLEEKNVREVSKELGIKENTIYQKITRGRKKIIRFRERREEN